MKSFIKFSILILISYSCVKKNTKPNLVFILTDEQRYDTSIHYGNGKIITPSLNQLGNESIVFERAYVTQPVCSPNRSAIMTGLFPHQTGVTMNKIPLDEGIETFPELLGDDAYQTSYIGKWHLGKEIDPSHGFKQRISIEDRYHHKEDIAAGLEEIRYSDYHKWLINLGYQPDIDQRETFSRYYCTDLPYEHTKSSFIENKALDFLEENQNNPFILYLGFLEPHTPVNGPFNDIHKIDDVQLDETYATYIPEKEPLRNKIVRINEMHNNIKTSENNKMEILREEMKKYWGLVHQVDLSVGKIMFKLRALGLDKKTIVVFTSEHGRMMGKFGIAPKRFMYDASSRIPLFIKAPGHQSRKVTYPVSQIDIVPTLLKLFGKTIPSNLPGKNLFDFESADVFMEWNTDFSGVGKPTNGKKYDECPAQIEDCDKAMLQNIRTVLTPKGLKLSISAEDYDLSELYDLEKDPKEKNNLYYDLQYKDTVTLLKQKILDWQKRVNDNIML